MEWKTDEEVAACQLNQFANEFGLQGVPGAFAPPEAYNLRQLGYFMPAQEKIDWSECALIEVKPGVQSGAPVLRGTRMPADAIVDNFDYGMAAPEIALQFELATDLVEAILKYAKSHRIAHRF
jgi:uncharacterized protein (DUF433 family)